jgi:hypothetical protein
MLDTLIRVIGYPLITGMICVLLWKRTWRLAPLFCLVEAFEFMETMYLTWMITNPYHLERVALLWCVFYLNQNIRKLNMLLDIASFIDCSRGENKFIALAPFLVLRWGLKAWRYARVDVPSQLRHDHLYYAYTLADFLVPLVAIVLSYWGPEAVDQWEDRSADPAAAA